MWKPISSFLDTALNKTGARQMVEAATIVEAAGPILMQIMPELRQVDFKVVSYQQGTLKIGVANPAVGQELRMRQDPILEVLRDTFPKNQLARLRMVPLIEEREEY